MYGIKRNVKMNPIVKKENKINPIVTKNPHRLKSNGFSKYKFPVYEEVPSAKYFSKITDAKYTVTKSGKDAVEILYEIKDGVTCYKIANGILPDDTQNNPYYIKQVYPEGSQYYNNFVDSMAEALDKNDFELDEVIGVTEYTTLSYDKSDIGGFSERVPFEWDDFIVLTSQNDDVTEVEYY